MLFSVAASGWAGWALAYLEFGSSVNPITTRGADYAHHTTACPSGFENPAASLTCEIWQSPFQMKTEVAVSYSNEVCNISLTSLGPSISFEALNTSG